MKSGLGDRNNNAALDAVKTGRPLVSMKSGLGDRNNWLPRLVTGRGLTSQ